TKESMVAQADAERETRERQAEASKLAQEAEAKRDAAVGEAQADKDRRTAEAGAAARRAAEIANFQAAQAIAEQQREANLKKADADMAYELQKKTIEIQLMEQENLRKEKELEGTIKRHADAKRYEIETLAAAELKRVENQAQATKTQGLADAHVKQAQGVAQAEVNKAQGIAEAEIRQAQGLAVAEAQKAQGLAEALGMEKKAEAWKKYNEAAVLQILAPILPEIARAIAEPLSKIDRITLVNTGNGDSGVARVTGEIAKVITQVPPVIESLTGLNMEKLFDKLRDAPPKEEPPTKK
ncbi:MAG: flotillin domain-containing protein, partial [Vicinamibacteria bacterium]